MRSDLFKIIAALILLVFFAGCMNFDYVGQSFAPKSESAVVNIFNGREKIPADQYRIIGRGTLTGPLSTDEYDRMAELRAVARKHGADAVCIVSATTKAVGYYPQSNGAFAPPISASVAPERTVGSPPACIKESAHIEVQVLLPCIPETPMR